MMSAGVADTDRENVWLGVTVEDQQRADERIPLLLQVPAAVRFLSVEPMLGPVDISSHLANVCQGVHWGRLRPGTKDPAWPSAISWVICGGESGHGARPMHPDWARSLRDQCQAAGVPFFMKQMGSNLVDCGGRYGAEWPWPNPATKPYEFEKVELAHPKGGDWDEWPEEFRIRGFPSAIH
jgi:protein gp37